MGSIKDHENSLRDDREETLSSLTVTEGIF
jgi:hypothetical protein